LKTVFLVGNTIFEERISHLASFDLRKQLFRRTLKMHPGAFDADGAGELMSRFTYDVDNVYRGLHALFGKAVREPLKMLACLIGAAVICWRLLLLSLVLAPVAAFAVNRLARSLKRANRRAMEEMSHIYAVLEETIQGIKVVQAFTMEQAERKRFHQRNKQYFFKAMRIAGYESLTRPLTEMTGIFTILVALLCGAYLVLRQKTHLGWIPICDRPLDVSMLVAFYGFLIGVSDPARKMSEVFSRLQRAFAASERIYQLIDRRSEIKNPARPKSLPRHHREIEFRAINFHYKPGTPVLRDVSLRVPYGETIALVGANGCGKSTLVNLLPRFFDPTQGAVLLDGIDVRDVRLRELRRQIGLVPQHTLLFDDTVFNNIRYGCPDATREQVIAAARQAHAHQFIQERLSDGYETIVGPQGNQLSGGQRQRLALARAILRDPAILILDEATSQIDVESEQLIHQVLEQFTRDRTAIIITHRLSTLALADRIVVMDAGRIADLGQHDELLRRCELYARLHDVHFKMVA
jgi:ATP-binding cassette subfamily B protein/subfamily B ATP-binding cassette protein MsbA